MSRLTLQSFSHSLHTPTHHDTCRRSSRSHAIVQLSLEQHTTPDSGATPGAAAKGLRTRRGGGAGDAEAAVGGGTPLRVLRSKLFLVDLAGALGTLLALAWKEQKKVGLAWPGLASVELRRGGVLRSAAHRRLALLDL